MVLDFNISQNLGDRIDYLIKFHKIKKNMS